MSESRKTWMIEAGDVLDVMTPGKKQPATAVPVRRHEAEPRPMPAAPVVDTTRRRAKAPASRKSRLHFAPLAILTYALGPLALLLTSRGRRHQIGLVLAGMSVIATVALTLSGFAGLVRTEHPASVWAWLALLAIAVGGGFTAWARAIHLLAGEGLPPLNRLPYWLRRKWSISLLGLVAPGSGLLLGGRTGRAALTLWLMGPAVAAVVVLLNALGLWRHHLASGWLANSGPLLESALMVAAAVAVVGFLGYIAQALEGVRQVLVEPGLQTRVKGDYYAVAVIAAVVAVIVAVNPVQLAHQIDMGGSALRAEGFQAIPLRLAMASQHLDPGRPEYALQVAELYTELGETDKAAAVRAELDHSLSTYLAMVQKEAVADFGLARARTGADTRMQSPPAPAEDPSGPQTATDRPDWYLGAMMKSAGAATGATDSARSGDTPATGAPGANRPFGPGLTVEAASAETGQRLGPPK